MGWRSLLFGRKSWSQIAALAGAAILKLLEPQAAFAQASLDQSNEPAWNGAWTNFVPSNRVGQTFQPGRSPLVAIEVDLLTGNPGRGGDSVTLELIDDAGSILFANTVPVADGFDGLLRFEMPAGGIPVDTSRRYLIHLEDTGKVNFGWRYDFDTYPNGTQVFFGAAQPRFDFFFVTYSSAGDCTDQVTVAEYFAQPFDENLLFPEVKGSRLVLNTSPKGNGISFKAQVDYRAGPIPLDALRVQFIQNATGHDGTVKYDPSVVEVAELRPGSTPPLLDRDLNPLPGQPAFFDNDFANPAPGVFTEGDRPKIKVPLASRGFTLREVDITDSFRMHLGCYDARDGLFHTLSVIDWTVHYSGAMGPGQTFIQGPGKAISIQPAVPSHEIPVQTCPIIADAVCFEPAAVVGPKCAPAACR